MAPALLTLKSMHPKKLTLSLLAALSLAVTQAFAVPVLYIDAGANSNYQDFSGGNYVAGSEFTVSTSIEFDALGYLDAQGDGLDGSHTVGLWDVATQSLIAQTTVTSASFQLLSAQGTAMWFLESIGSTLTLGPGTYRVAGLTGSEADADAMSNDQVGNGVSVTGGYVRTDFPNGGIDYPGLSFGSNAIRATVANLGTASSSVPDAASSLVLCSIGLLGLGLMRRVRLMAAA